MDRTAFCPGHVTGFFEICRSEDALSTGSRGAGMCLSLGATSRVRIVSGERQRISVRVGGSRSRANVTREAIRELIGPEPFEVDVLTKLDLPMRQGFGMSAAGCLSATVAASDILALGRQRAFEAAHVAEVRCGGGLGDVSAIHKGGITVRRKAGLPPIGEVLRIDGEPEVVLAVVGGELPTKAVLKSRSKVEAINASGSGKVERLLSEPTLGRLMELSLEFASETGLASDEVLRAIGVASESGQASMSMLGSSIFAIGDSAPLRRSLSELGEVWACRVDLTGPRVLVSKS